MKYAFLVLAFSICFAQAQPDAAALLRDVAETAQATQNWHIEGSVSYPERQSKATFSLLQRSPGQSRFGQEGGDASATVVCDGSDIWIYSTPLNRYSKAPLTGTSACSSVIEEWKRLPVTLASPVMAGKSSYTSQGQPQECQLVRGSFPAEMPMWGTMVRTLCIDTANSLVIWERDEGKFGSRTYVYSQIDRPATLPPDDFVFVPPAGSILTNLPLPVPKRLGSASMPQETPEYKPPRTSSTKPPEYDEVSRRNRIQGSVTLYVVIDVTGHPSDIAVFHSLDPNLDASAVKTVRQWRFHPAERNGQPCEAAALVEMNYNLAR